MKNDKKAFVFDIDGTIADNTHRLHFIMPEEGQKKNWKAYNEQMFKDTIIEDVVFFMDYTSNYILISTGRDETYREYTERWLLENNITYDRMYMRQKNDYRQDDIIKKESLDMMIAEGYEPVLAFEDRDRCVKMYRDNGIRCFQVRNGDY